MNTGTENMVYVAADPAQPGTAWAICADRPEWAKDTAKSIAEWLKQGAHVMRVDHVTGWEMLNKWEHPTTTGDLFGSAA